MKKAFSAALILLSAVCLVLFTGCGGDSSSNYMVDGLEFSDIAVTRIENDYFNLSVTVKNTTNQSKNVDLSRLRLKLDDTTEIKHFSGVEVCPAASETPFSIMIDNDHPEMKKGDSVTVYFGDDTVCKIKITEL